MLVVLPMAKKAVVQILRELGTKRLLIPTTLLSRDSSPVPELLVRGRMKPALKTTTNEIHERSAPTRADRI